MVGMVVVKYVVESMSRELLCKFPDNSAFDFDYSQSCIWSPLPLVFTGNSNYTIRDHNDNDDDDDDDDDDGVGVVMCSSGSGTQRKLAYEAEKEEEDKGLLKQVTIRFKKKLATSTVFFDSIKKLNVLKHSYKKNKNAKNKKKASFDFSPSPVPSPNKGWAKILKVASKRFKKSTKKKEPTTHIKLSNCLMKDSNF
ncbi:pheromone-processing carboxypeptidase KEX1-like [Actinidia eriantha]|uniref:pheromone-processing carboxypeptidase KEX1-like n=1 Tax=Actinidia eriantha TaxID=165200 RepID=UPI002585B276|nr:pheromone-processing carboxypeptidase KEX1-like [Actinidia eriantha]